MEMIKSNYGVLLLLALMILQLVQSENPVLLPQLLEDTDNNRQLRRRGDGAIRGHNHGGNHSLDRDSTADACARSNPCIPTDEGGTCLDLNPNTTTPIYRCGCRPGFSSGLATGRNGRSYTGCVNQNECQLGTDTLCHAKADCIDTIGSYDCQCAVNYYGDGKDRCDLATDDLGIRFSKIAFENGNVPPLAVLPLTAANYPMSKSTFQWLRHSEAHSITMMEICTECDMPFADLIDMIGGEPSHPSSDLENGEYWKEFEHVVDVQMWRRMNFNSMYIMPLPLLWKGRTLDEIAESVHDEYPGIQHVTLIEELNRNGGLIVNTDIIPDTVKVEFIRNIVMVADLVTWAIARVGPLNFGLKWAVGRIRPEEMAFQISQGTFTAVSETIRRKVEKLELTTPESFTSYDEGCPNHPSWPAMHSAGSAASLWMAVVLDLTDEEWCQVKLTDYAVSYARTVAGVHYESDNIAGLNLGQEVVARRLPQHLFDHYGSNMTDVEARIEEKRFDWRDFEDSACFYYGMQDGGEDSNA